MRVLRHWPLIVIGLGICGCAQTQTEATADLTGDDTPAPPAITLGDGKANWIKIADVRRNGAELIVPEVLIDADGWLVIHRFKDGKPYGKDYLAATFVNRGTNLDVPITLPEAPAPGTPMLIMLHSDVNQDGQFDFVFVDEQNVLDKAVFEGSTMVAKIFQAP
ncbi:MAG: hypothetical protein AAF290_01330 [Pseudomonadota bacterium]